MHPASRQEVIALAGVIAFETLRRPNPWIHDHLK
jgi:hypothetical protein